MKLTKLQRSNNAHYRLRRKWTDAPGRRADVHYRYHNECLRRHKSRILSRSERRRLFGEISRKYGS